MTALAMIIGMVPMALGAGEGGEQNAPLGRAVIGGLICATVATLIFVPTVFSLLHGGREQASASPLRREHNGTMSTQGADMPSETEINGHRSTQAGEFPVEKVPPMPRKPGHHQSYMDSAADRCFDPAAVVVYGIHARIDSQNTLKKQTEIAQSPQSISSTHGRPLCRRTLALPGNTQAFTDTPIYSRTSGYLKKWYFDIGARVKNGQLMAEIETPELDQQLQVAEDDLKSAQANLDLANNTSARYQNLLKTNSVSKQETDVAMSDASAKKAAVDASMAAVRRLQQLQSFEKIYAPFDGIITARNTDIGALIQAGENSTTRAELFHLAAHRRHPRLRRPCPRPTLPPSHTGDKATLTLDEYPGKVFEGTITRNSSAIDPGTRTLTSRWI